LPNSVTGINQQSFAKCTSLESLPNLSNVLHLGNSAFANCTSLDGVVNMPNVTNDFAASEFALTKISKVQSLGQIKRLSYNSSNTVTGSFSQCTELDSVVLPDTLNKIGPFCFYGCTKLSNIPLPQSIQEISSNAFCNCTSLSFEDLQLPNLTSLGQNAFLACQSLEYIDLPSIEKLGNVVFRDCISLKHIKLGSNVTSIGQYQFGDSTAAVNNVMEYIMCEAVTPPTLGTSAWYNTNNCPIYVPDASVEAYKTASGWSSYADRIKPLSEYVES
jgi:hypothetical protein